MAAVIQLSCKLGPSAIQNIKCNHKPHQTPTKKRERKKEGPGGGGRGVVRGEREKRNYARTSSHYKRESDASCREQSRRRAAITYHRCRMGAVECRTASMAPPLSRNQTLCSSSKICVGGERFERRRRFFFLLFFFLPQSSSSCVG